MSVDPIILLQVGERHFITLKSTLEEGSTFFRALLAEEWQGSRSPDGSYFIDADPDLFVYSLRYLRRGVFPLFYNATYGFDFALYHALQEEALYFGIENLYNWIKDQKYAQAVKIQYTLDEIKGDGVSAMDHFTTIDGTSDRSYHPTWGTEKVYQCPRNIFVHMGNPNACGRACDKARGDEGDTYIDREILRTLIITKNTVFSGASSSDRSSGALC